MGLKAMVTVDLNQNVTSSERRTFNEKMAERKWTKVEPLTTVWRASFNDDIEYEDVVRTTKSDVRQAVKEADIDSFEAGVMVGSKTPSVF